MADSTAAGESLAAWIGEQASGLGFQAIGLTGAEAIPEAAGRLRDFLEARWQGDMAWLAETAGRRQSPKALWPEARSLILLGLSYAPARDPLAPLERRDRGTISVYAQGSDYHDLVKKRAKALARGLVERTACQAKVFVDTAPVMEKPLAAAAGLGWQGKHTNLVSRREGSWLFLAAIFTDLDLPADRPESDRCGSCRRCLEVCPTDAFPAPYQLDARRCISYLTIEHKGPIPAEFRAAMGNRIYGCDDCLAVCPWNKFAQRSREAAFHPRAELSAPRLADLAALDETGFRQVFAGSPIKRTGRDRFLRNVLIALGNSGEEAALSAVEARLTDPSPLVRGMAVWALGRLADPDRVARERRRALGREEDPHVLAEWRALGERC